MVSLFTKVLPKDWKFCTDAVSKIVSKFSLIFKLYPKNGKQHENTQTNKEFHYYYEFSFFAITSPNV